MPVTVNAGADLEANWMTQLGTLFQAWINANPTFRVGVLNGNTYVPQNMTFDSATVQSGAHGGGYTTEWDSNSAPHHTIRLTNPGLRAAGMWYVLHWRPQGPSTVSPRPDNSASYQTRKERRKRKKQAGKQREQQNKRGGRGGGGAGGRAMPVK